MVWIAADLRQFGAQCNSVAVLTLTAIARRASPPTARRLLLLSRRGEKPARLSRPGTNRRRHRPATEQVATMKHSSTQALFDYWNRKRGTRLAPDRADIDPAAIRHALGDTFMLAADFVDQLRFRLAGTRVCALFSREIKGEEFRTLWGEASVKLIDDLLTVVNNESVGAVAGLTGRTEDATQIDLELMLLPLAHTGHARIRALGVLVPLAVPYWLGEKPVVELEMGTLRHIGSDLETHIAPRLMHATEAVELRHGFVVYSGGREVPPGKKTG
jgi:hypothetical protein